jgi:O-antigen ligase
MARALTRIFAASVAAMAAIGLAGVYAGPAPLPLRVSAGGLLLLAAWRPADALLLLAAFGPLGGALDAVFQYRDGWTVPLMLAAAAGYLARLSARPDATDRPLLVAVLIWAWLVVTSLVPWLVAHPGPGVLARLSEFVAAGFPLRTELPLPGAWAAAVAMSGVVAYLMAGDLCAKTDGLDRRVVRTLLCSCSALGVLNAYRLVEVALRNPPFLTTLIEVHRWMRVSVTFPDPNAAGACFLLMLPAAVFVLGDRTMRPAAVMALPWLVAGLWLSGSRTALILFVLVLAIAAPFLLRGRRSSWRIPAIALVLASALTVAFFYPRPKTAGDASMAFGVRREMALATLRMLRDHPLSGVGVGRYMRESPAYMSQQMKTWYPSENAHNQFLQAAGELGLPGLVMFVLLLWMGIASAVRDAWNGEDRFVTGVVLGVLSFLAASLTMHPLLIPEVAVAFWLMLGMCRARGSKLLIGPATPSSLGKEPMARTFLVAK